MNQRNEIAYLKNKAALPIFENDLPGMDDGVNNSIIGIPRKGDGVNNDIIGIPRMDDGVNNVINAIPRMDDGINNVINAIPRTDDGQNNNILGIPRSDDGVNKKIDGVKTSDDGLNSSNYGFSPNGLGVKHVLEALYRILQEGNGEARVYAVFEKALLNALEEYIKKGDGQNSLFQFYSDFEDAVGQINLAAAKLRENPIILRLEDTHIMPEKINESEAITKLVGALRQHLAPNSSSELRNTIAVEFMYSYYYGKATSNQLQEVTNLSDTGFAKAGTIGICTKTSPIELCPRRQIEAYFSGIIRGSKNYLE